MSLNKCIIQVDQIRSYQVLLYKRGYNSFPTKAYKEYKKELKIGMKDLKPIPDNTPIKLTLTFNVKDAVDTAKWRVKMKSTDNTSRMFDSEKEALSYHDEDKHYIEHSPSQVKYGACGDVDNIFKPVVDYLEELEIIKNDRYVVDATIKKTFNNEEESIEVLLEELKVKETDKNVKFV